LSPDGASLSYSTYIGGSSGDDGLWAIAVDTSGNAYVTGHTESADFPILHPYQASHGGAWDTFVTKIAPSGSSLSYSTYLGGKGIEAGYGIALDASGNAYITGNTSSTDFPTTNAYERTYQGGAYDAYITKIAPSGSSLSYSTYLGGAGDDGGWGIAVDPSGSAYVAGYTFSTDFPTQTPYQGSYKGNVDGFVTKLSPDGASLSYSTYIGGSSGDDGLWAIAVDTSGNAYVTGNTTSADLPTPNAYQDTLGGGWDAYVAKIDPSGSSLSYSTYLGGSGEDRGYGVAIDQSSNAYITGYTESDDFPTAGAY